jgi:hypothetical protein
VRVQQKGRRNRLDAGPLIVGNDRLAEPQAVYALGVLFCGNVEDLGSIFVAQHGILKPEFQSAVAWPERTPVLPGALAWPLIIGVS